MKTTIHPGQILLEEFMIPFKITQNQPAKAIDVSAIRINEIIVHMANARLQQTQL